MTENIYLRDKIKRKLELSCADVNHLGHYVGPAIIGPDNKNRCPNCAENFAKQQLKEINIDLGIYILLIKIK